MTLVEKETGKNFVQMEETDCKKKDYASKNVAGTALGLGIAGTALWLLNNHCGNGLFGGNCNRRNDNDIYIERKECQDYVDLTNAMWRHVYNEQNQRFEDRQTTNQRLFGVYESSRNAVADLTAKHNADAFALYRAGRDSKDEVMAEINALRTEVAIMKAVRPYQDKLIQCDINNVACTAAYNLERRTCRMIEGDVVLPLKPTVEGLPSQRCCCKYIPEEK